MTFTKQSRRTIILFSILTIVTILVQIFVPGVFPVNLLASTMYSCVIIAWALTVSRRIVQKNIRCFLIVSAAFLLLLFLLRMARYCFFEDNETILRYLWYLYYIPMTAVPLLSFFCSLCVGKINTDRPLVKWWWLWIVWTILVIGITTNDAHQLTFRFTGDVKAYESYTHSWLYFAAVIWSVSLAIASFVILMRKCRLSQCRQLAWIPMLPFTIAAVLLIIYYIQGGSPAIYGHRLYKLQEVYGLMAIGLWEGCIQIGLIPSNTGYGEIFSLSSVGAFITDTDGNIIYHSQNYTAKPDENTRIRSTPISGGTVYWAEDLSAINSLNERLSDVTERIAEENTLLTEENNIKEMRTRYETQNRIYDDIALSVHAQLVKINALINEQTESEDEFRKKLAYASVLGAYVKRRANLTLISDGAEVMNIDELRFAIRESMEYISLTGIVCDVNADKSTDVSSDVILLAYDLFETVTETAINSAGSLMVYISADKGICMTIMLDALDTKPDTEKYMTKLAALNGTLAIKNEDGAVYIRLSFGEGAAL